MSKSLANNRATVTGGKWQMHVCKSGQGHRGYSVADLVSFVCAFLVLAAMAPAVADVAETKTDAGNVYLSGDEIRVTEPVVADLFAAGRRVVIDRPVGADGVLGGATVDVKSDIGQDLRVAGGTVNVDGAIRGDLLATGGTVRVAKSSAVSGSALIAGGKVIVDGRLAHGVKIYAREISISGQIVGDTRLYGQQVVLVPGARIEGDLIYASTDPLPPEQLAQVSGKVVREDTPEGWKTASDRSAHAGAWFRPVFFLSMLVCGSLLFILFPNAVAGTRQSIKRYPLRSLLIGLALLFALPPVAILLMITLIGLPIGLGLLALYPLLLLLGYLAAAFFIGRVAADAMNQPKDFTLARQIAFLAGALLILTLAAMIPVLGGLLVFLALVTGIGGWAVWLHQRYRGEISRAQDTSNVGV